MVVVFDSSDAHIEKLALAAAVGAVQGRANIRLRRADGTPESPEYVKPREADALWADAVISGAPSGCGLESLQAFADGKLAGKVGSALTGSFSINAAICTAGLIAVPSLSDAADALERARLQGRRVAEISRALKALAECKLVVEGVRMPADTHRIAAEMHDKAAHAHRVAAAHHGNEDHLTAHEISVQALDHSRRAFEKAQEAHRETSKAAGKPE